MDQSSQFPSRQPQILLIERFAEQAGNARRECQLARGGLFLDTLVKVSRNIPNKQAAHGDPSNTIIGMWNCYIHIAPMKTT